MTANGPDATYQALLARGVLGFQACGACDGAVFPPRGRCSHCGADALVWRESAGVGTVYSTTVITPRDQPAYAVVLVDLDEGFRMMSRIVAGVDAHDVSIGDAVTVRIEPLADQILPLFATQGDTR
jgi:uncharacterized OB-fold protein